MNWKLLIIFTSEKVAKNKNSLVWVLSGHSNCWPIGFAKTFIFTHDFCQISNFKITKPCHVIATIHHMFTHVTSHIFSIWRPFFVQLTSEYSVDVPSNVSCIHVSEHGMNLKLWFLISIKIQEAFSCAPHNGTH